MAKSRSPLVDQLWEEAKSGSRKLTATERRRVLVYLDEVGEQNASNKPYSNVELAKLFKVGEKVIRDDKTRLLREIGKALTPEAQIMVVAAHMRDIDNLISRGQRGLAANESGTLGERFYLETLLKLLKEKRETYENVGVIRKELGTINVAEEHWVAEARVDTGTLTVRQATDAEHAEADEEAVH